MKINTPIKLEEVRASFAEQLKNQTRKVLVCGETGCVACGALEVYDKLLEEAKSRGLNIQVELKGEPGNHVGMKKCACHGLCEIGPLLVIEPEEYMYIKVKPEDCADIVEQTLIGGKPVERLMYKADGKVYKTQHEIPFYKNQTFVARSMYGPIDSDSIDEYIARGGYSAFSKALFKMTPEEIRQQISDAGLRGRGGGGFPTGRKWQQVARQKEPKRYVVCNGDEGDPGAFMDRSFMEGNPNAILEGMMIAGVATGADEGYIYVRAEYPLAVNRLERAIEKANEKGLLGEKILGSNFNFKININKGAGAFVCGEGSAMTVSIEGNRGFPRTKPPRTVEAGLFGKPTVLNNVETFVNVPLIINNGADWFKSYGTEKSPGTKAFAITGNISNTGLIEVPMGATLRKVIYDIGGGVKDGRKFKAVQIGGPSGGCLTNEHLDLPLDFDSLTKVGAMVGSGGLVVMDDSACMVEIARFFMNFTRNESCGKCIPCREGTKRMLEIMEKIVSGTGTLEDLDLLQELADTIVATSLCGLGKTAPNPVISTLRYFRDEYVAHVVDKKCPANICEKLKAIVIKAEKCKGCSKCAKVCPAGAISGVIKEPFVIDQSKCIKCDACITSCTFGAIEKE